MRTSPAEDIVFCCCFPDSFPTSVSFRYKRKALMKSSLIYGPFLHLDRNRCCCFHCSAWIGLSIPNINVVYFCESKSKYKEIRNNFFFFFFQFRLATNWLIFRFFLSPCLSLFFDPLLVRALRFLLFNAINMQVRTMKYAQRL